MDRRLEVIGSAGLAELRDRWERQFGIAPSKHLSRKLLVRALAYEHQVKAASGLKIGVRRKLKAIAKGEVSASSAAERPAGLLSGGRLVREWHGTTYVVEVTDQGFLWKGETYTSLTAVAFAITGAKWNGRRFFGIAKGPTAARRSAA